MFHSAVYMHKYIHGGQCIWFCLHEWSPQSAPCIKGLSVVYKKKKSKRQCGTRQRCLCAYMRDNVREMGGGGWDGQRRWVGLSNTLLIKVKEMFYSWSRRQQKQQQGQGWNELVSPVPQSQCCTHSPTPGQHTPQPLTLINNVNTHSHTRTPSVSLISNFKSHFLMVCCEQNQWVDLLPKNKVQYTWNE